MANQGATKQSKQTGQSKSAQGGQTKQNSQSSNRPLDDLSYDMVTVLYEKSKALEAFDKYIQDAQSDEQTRQLFEQMQQADEQFVQQLREQIGQRLMQSDSPAGQPSMKGYK